MNNSIGTRIRYYRMKRRMTQEQLAEAADLSVSLISKVETNSNTIGKNGAIKVAKALNISVGDLLEDRAPAEGTINSILCRLEECERPVLYVVEDVVKAIITSINTHL
ncbi:transcriptional regulator with XRE-family HTH domain [Lachnospiraceae bacterium PF1-21]|uniref:Helix-turn-helix domain-containing protein n=1 Tax=Ohessyouella blattaphilus TaxID=2949333 RepID=A0ABT1EL90_9FIRM|nr:helix-turn-helix transcriptional regulator [Ohessyouella blattaphilus]MCP1111479.1 helix-turn-helix domain-containing protein [Ohessyouella blattaphilus]MCR8564873.1 helix-turn-helix domain-containing protein [Ohessyouella blattaphilus]